MAQCFVYAGTSDSSILKHALNERRSISSFDSRMQNPGSKTDVIEVVPAEELLNDLINQLMGVVFTPEFFGELCGSVISYRQKT